MTPDSRSSPSVGQVLLAISTFHGDEQVIATLNQLHETGDHPFAAIVIADSARSSAVADVVVTQGWRDVEYVPLESNVGSAGNLLRRCQYALGKDLPYVYVVNHDGRVDVNAIARLLAAAECFPRPGALYPLRFNSLRGEFDLTGVRRGPGTFIGVSRPPPAAVVPVFWGSSNGALYSVRALRDGVLPRGDLWMGWEDLAFGLSLHRQGWSQHVVTDARVVDDYEYTPRGIGSRGVMISDKPAWYEYYSSRNLVLMARCNPRDLPLLWASLRRILTSAVVICLWKSDRRRRFLLLARGVLHGLEGRAGKWVVP